MGDSGLVLAVRTDLQRLRFRRGRNRPERRDGLPHRNGRSERIGSRDQADSRVRRIRSKAAPRETALFSGVRPREFFDHFQNRQHVGFGKAHYAHRTVARSWRRRFEQFAHVYGRNSRGRGRVRSLRVRFRIEETFIEETFSVLFVRNSKTPPFGIGKNPVAHGRSGLRNGACPYDIRIYSVAYREPEGKTQEFLRK